MTEKHAGDQSTIHVTDLGSAQDFSTAEKHNRKKIFNYCVTDSVTNCEASIQATTALVDQAAQTSFRFGEQINNIKWVMRKRKEDSAREFIPECTISLIDLQ